jgi:CRP-like cAMP-binding protein
MTSISALSISAPAVPPAANDLAPATVGPAEVAALGRLPFLAGLDPTTLARLARHARWRSLEPGEVVIDFGDPSDDVFLVADGSVRVIVRTASGHEIILNDLGPGDIFGELAAIDGAPRSANVTALHRSRVCTVSGTAFLEVVLASPQAAHRLLRLLSERFRAKDERLLELSTLPVRHRLYAELYRLSRERAGGGGTGTAGERVISPPPPHHIVGMRIGARREAVSREMSELVRAGLITANRRAIVLLRPEALRSAVEAQLRGAVAGER